QVCLYLLDCIVTLLSVVDVKMNSVLFGSKILGHFFASQRTTGTSRSGLPGRQQFFFNWTLALLAARTRRTVCGTQAVVCAISEVAICGNHLRVAYSC